MTLPRTLANVWYRDEAPPGFAIPYADSGTLEVGPDRVSYRGEHHAFDIPAQALESVVWRPMDGDLQNEWAVVSWRDGATLRRLGLTAADRFRFETSNRELYSALVLAWEGARAR